MDTLSLHTYVVKYQISLRRNDPLSCERNLIYYQRNIGQFQCGILNGPALLGFCPINFCFCFFFFYNNKFVTIRIIIFWTLRNKMKSPNTSSTAVWTFFTIFFFYIYKK